MNRLTNILALVLAFWVLPALSAVAEETPEISAEAAQVARIEGYLKSIRTLSADFLQVNPDGGVAQGRLYMARPGAKVRLEYAPPSELLIVGSDGWVVLYDGETDEDSRWPIGDTPLAVLLDEKVDLTKGVAVSSVDSYGGVLRATFQDAENPENGALTLAFQESPLALRQWQVIDPQDLVTTVTLAGLHLNEPLDAELFVYEFEDLSFENDD